MRRLILIVMPLTLLLAVALGAAGERHDVFSVPSVETEGSGPQPVDVMNWLIDENGNLRVSPQVRGVVTDLLDEDVLLTFSGGSGGHEWISDPVECGWANRGLFLIEKSGNAVVCGWRSR